MIIVLAYHNVCESGVSTSWLTVSQNSFKKQMKLLKRFCNFVHPEMLFAGEIVDSHKPNVLLTFDDGFVGNYQYAALVLRELEIPALFFVSTANLLEQRPFWFEEVIQLVQQEGLTDIDLRHIGLGHYQLPEKGSKARWKVINRLLEDIKARAVNHPEDEIGDITESIVPQCSERYLSDVTSMLLTKKQVLELNREDQFVFGSHSHRHRILTDLNDQELAFELSHSKLQLEELLGEEVVSIAYPNGDVNQRVCLACERAGYSWGFSTNAGAYNSSSPPFQIPRKMIGGFDSITQFSRSMLLDCLKFRT
jgi:peptidoglycan/xylan/chitin deacetylase (PgdA/CDA1 family)